jgi:hypothetical protein
LEKEKKVFLKTIYKELLQQKKTFLSNQKITGYVENWAQGLVKQNLDGNIIGYLRKYGTKDEKTLFTRVTTFCESIPETDEDEYNDAREEEHIKIFQDICNLLDSNRELSVFMLTYLYEIYPTPTTGIKSNLFLFFLSQDDDTLFNEFFEKNENSTQSLVEDSDFYNLNFQSDSLKINDDNIDLLFQLFEHFKDVKEVITMIQEELTDTVDENNDTVIIEENGNKYQNLKQNPDGSRECKLFIAKNGV